jgi:predicted metal-dependent hydrolase
MPTIQDDEFGTIIIRRSTRASQVTLRVGPNGTIRASMPLYAPVFLVKRLLKNSREQLRQLLADHHSHTTYSDGMHIGKSHTLVVRHKEGGYISVSRHKLQIIAIIPIGTDLNDPAVTPKLSTAANEALRIEAKSYLPNRLRHLAAKHGFTYQKVRFSHAGSRWGSCSSNGTISLNIALMKLPFELIDYVLIHELSHTVEMNHSERFWQLVQAGDPQYKQHRKLLKLEHPSI